MPKAWVHVLLQRPQPSVAPSSHTSGPHLMPSPQTGFEHSPPVQYVQSQSVPMPHALPGPHLLQALEPPQSTSVSVWFLRPSEQLWTWHVRAGPQRALLQSTSVVQF
jgi:hypothetical protein